MSHEAREEFSDHVYNTFWGTVKPVLPNFTHQPLPCYLREVEEAMIFSKWSTEFDVEFQTWKARGLISEDIRRQKHHLKCLPGGRVKGLHWKGAVIPLMVGKGTYPLGIKYRPSRTVRPYLKGLLVREPSGVVKWLQQRKKPLEHRKRRESKWTMEETINILGT